MSSYTFLFSIAEVFEKKKCWHFVSGKVNLLVFSSFVSRPLLLVDLIVYVLQMTHTGLS